VLAARARGAAGEGTAARDILSALVGEHLAARRDTITCALALYVSDCAFKTSACAFACSPEATAVRLSAFIFSVASDVSFAFVSLS
jgi:hypothetical protein